MVGCVNKPGVERRYTRFFYCSFTSKNSCYIQIAKELSSSPIHSTNWSEWNAATMKLSGLNATSSLSVKTSWRLMCKSKQLVKLNKMR